MKMQTSRVRWESGFMHISGTATIVNSVFQAFETGQGRQQRIIASYGGSIMLEACSISAGTLDCDPICRDLTGPGLIIAEGGTIQLKASAVGVTFPASGTNPLIRVASGGNVTATTDPNPNWTQPVAGQNAAALRTILNQPALLTDPPGLPATPQWANYISAAVTPLLGTTNAPGKLINAVTGANTTNVLISPIDGTVITNDVFGNPRTDAGGTVRDIGAVQLSLAPTLNLTSIGDRTAALSWTRPHDPTSGPITGYAVLYTSHGGTTTNRVDVAGAQQTTLTVTNLTNGTVYDFHVVAVNGVGDGPPSNLESATPYGPVQAPALLTMPSNGVVQVTWSTPDSGGGVITGYNVMYRSVGSPAWEFFAATTSTAIAVTGLVNNVTYELGVIAFASGSRSSGIGAAESTPVKTGLLKHPSWSGGLFHYQLLGLSSRSYAIEASTNLMDSNAWVTVQPLVALPPNGMTNLIDAPGAFTSRFYRAILLP